MSAQRLSVPTPDGVAQGWLHLPDREGASWPTIVFFNDAAGTRPATLTMAARLSNAGYAVFQPELYWRSGPYAPFDRRTLSMDPAEQARLAALMGAVRVPLVMADAAAVLDSLKGDARLRTKRIGTIGYCMGGRLAFLFATALDRVAAVASIHAGGLVNETRESPHLACVRLHAEVYLAVAEDDPSCTEDHCDALHAGLKAANVRYVLENFLARHGWAVPDFPVYDEAAAEWHWERILDLFHRTLPA